MKKNKTMAYALAASLLVGGTFLGTKALFTDNVNVAGELAISTGDVDIEVIGNNEWVLDRNGSEDKDGSTLNHEGDTTNLKTNDEYSDGTQAPTTGNFANNLKPGDKLYKEITIENNGTLLAEVTLGENFEKDTLGALTGLVIPSQTVVVNANDNETFGDDGDKTFTSLEEVNFNLKPGQQAKIKLELNVENIDDAHNTAATKDSENYNDDDVENTVVNLNGVWTLDAQQQDKVFTNTK